MLYAKVGSISEGTLRVEDLLSTSATELLYHVNRNRAVLSPEDLDRYQQLSAEAEFHWENGEYEESPDDYPYDPDSWVAIAHDYIEKLDNALQDFAPLYTYFG